MLHIDGCHDLYVSDDGEADAVVITHEVLVPYLPGILKLHGIGRLDGETVVLDPTWSGFGAASPAQKLASLRTY